MLLNQAQRLRQLLALEPIVPLERYDRFDPEFSLAVRVLDVHVGSRLFTREEVETIAAKSKDRRTH
jgi:hypothetical protein